MVAGPDAGVPGEDDASLAGTAPATQTPPDAASDDLDTDPPTPADAASGLGTGGCPVEIVDPSSTAPRIESSGVVKPDPDVVIRFAGDRGRAGTRAEIVVTIEADAVGVSGLQFDLSAPAGLLSLPPQAPPEPGVVLGGDAAAAGKQLTVQALGGGYSRITIFSLNGQVIPDRDGDGAKQLAALRLDLAPSASPGPVWIEIENIVAVDPIGRSNGLYGTLNAHIIHTPTFIVCGG